MTSKWNDGFQGDNAGNINLHGTRKVTDEDSISLPWPAEFSLKALNDAIEATIASTALSPGDLERAYDDPAGVDKNARRGPSWLPIPKFPKGPDHVFKRALADDAHLRDVPEYICPIEGDRHIYDGKKWVKVVD